MPQLTIEVPGFDPERAGRRLLETWSEISDEVIDFTKGRLGRQIEASRTLADTRNPGLAIVMQVEYIGTAFVEFLYETNKIAHLSAKAAVSALSDLGQADDWQASRPAARFSEPNQDTDVWDGKAAAAADRSRPNPAHNNGADQRSSAA